MRWLLMLQSRVISGLLTQLWQSADSGHLHPTIILSTALWSWTFGTYEIISTLSRQTSPSTFLVPWNKSRRSPLESSNGKQKLDHKGPRSPKTSGRCSNYWTLMVWNCLPEEHKWIRMNKWKSKESKCIRIAKQYLCIGKFWNGMSAYCRWLASIVSTQISNHF